jgi:glutamate synthase (NADPH/NADH) small chain
MGLSKARALFGESLMLKRWGGVEMRWVQPLSYLGLVYAVFGYCNRYYLHWINSLWFSGWSIEIVIVVFGVWVVAVEKLRYVKIRLAVLTFLVATWWLLVPMFSQSNFLDFHVIGSIAFFAYLIVIFLFGRRADCGWNCPCVGIRDTVGDAFRNHTPRGEKLWKFRHVKWISLALILGYLVLVELRAFHLEPPWWWTYMNTFNVVTLGVYFSTLLVMPVIGNRFWCRFLCPWGALYGLVGTLGFYKIEADMTKCTECGACDRVCEMGVPVSALVKKSGQVKVADCVGCGRCVSSCPTQALRFTDVRSYIKPFARKVGRLLHWPLQEYLPVPVTIRSDMD